MPPHVTKALKGILPACPSVVSASLAHLERKFFEFGTNMTRIKLQSKVYQDDSDAFVTFYFPKVGCAVTSR